MKEIINSIFKIFGIIFFSIGIYYLYGHIKSPESQSDNISIIEIDSFNNVNIIMNQESNVEEVNLWDKLISSELILTTFFLIICPVLFLCFICGLCYYLLP